MWATVLRVWVFCIGVYISYYWTEYIKKPDYSMTIRSIPWLVMPFCIWYAEINVYISSMTKNLKCLFFFLNKFSMLKWKQVQYGWLIQKWGLVSLGIVVLKCLKPRFNIQTIFPCIVISVINVRQSWDHLTFISREILYWQHGVFILKWSPGCNSH